MFFVIVFVVFGLFTSLIQSLCPNNVPVLFPGVVLENQHVSPRLHEQKQFCLSGLKPNSQYEVRLNFPGTAPANFVLNFVDSIPTNQHRSLKDTEKIIFWTNDKGQIDNHEVPLLQIDTMPLGVSHSHEIEQREIVFNIVLEVLYLGGVPFDAFNLIIFAVVFLILAVYLSVRIITPTLLLNTYEYHPINDLNPDAHLQ
eukprot:c235_g1_i1.p1 GENE.c235_g1_i1~~c235_g1_i1.p1  ORF type:complete len:207 (+),score=64.29 c235_g1_i1:25-621(+)